MLKLRMLWAHVQNIMVLRAVSKLLVPVTTKNAQVQSNKPLKICNLVYRMSVGNMSDITVDAITAQAVEQEGYELNYEWIESVAIWFFYLLFSAVLASYIIMFIIREKKTLREL